MAGYYKETKSGNYRLFASGGAGPGGQRRRFTKTVSAKSPREAEKLLAQFVAEVENGKLSRLIQHPGLSHRRFIKRQPSAMTTCKLHNSWRLPQRKS